MYKRASTNKNQRKKWRPLKEDSVEIRDSHNMHHMMEWLLAGGLWLGGLFIYHKWNVAQNKRKQATIKRNLPISNLVLSASAQRETAIHDPVYERFHERVKILFKQVFDSFNEERVYPEYMALLRYSDTDEEIKEKIRKYPVQMVLNEVIPKLKDEENRAWWTKELESLL